MKKKLLFVISLLSFGAYAQSFPGPYCDVTEYEDVEEITQVSLNGVVINNTNTTDPLVDFTDEVVTLEKGQSYTITLKGNTYSDYINKFIMYIDWNNNGVLNDTGEDYIVGTIYDSDGTDDVSATFTFTVPESATLGNTRIRINKGYEDEDYFWYMTNDPCSISAYEEWFGDIYEDVNYGQMLDFTLDITEPTASIPSLDLTQLNVYPNPVKEVLHIDYKSVVSKVTISDINGRQVGSYELNATTSAILVDALSSGSYLLKVETEAGEISTVKFVKK